MKLNFEMNSQKSLKYGIIGVGHLGAFHIQQIQKIKDVILVGCYDINQKQAEKISNRYNIKPFTSLNKLLLSCDAVSIATPASYHFDVAKLALENNCHLFIEKPITHNLNEANALFRLSQKQNKLIQVGHIERFNPVFSCFNNSSPSPRFIEAHRLAPFNVRGTDVNVVLDLMIHDIDLILCLIKSPIKNISANGVNVLSESTDLANARIEFHNNAVVNLTASRISAKKMRKLRVFELHKYSSLNFDNFTIETYASHKKPNKTNRRALFEFDETFILLNSEQIQPINALYEELDAFIKSILYSTKIKVGASEAIMALDVALQIEEKINGGKKK